MSSWLAARPASRAGRCTGSRITSTSTAGTTARARFPPAGFWAAAAGHASPADQAALGDAAHARGLYRDAAQLHKNAAARGNLDAVFYLSNPPHCLRADVRPVRWAVAHVSLDDPGAVAGLLDSLREAGAREQVAALLARDPAAHVALDDPRAVAGLLDSLREAGAQEQVTALLAPRSRRPRLPRRPVRRGRLLDSLRAAGAQEQVAALLARDPAAHVPLDDPGAVAALLGSLREAGAQSRPPRWPTAPPPTSPSTTRAPWPRCWTACGRRARRSRPPRWRPRPPPTSPSTTRAPWPGCWTACGRRARQQVAALADRAAAHVSLDDPVAVAGLLDSLRAAGAQEQAAALAARAAAHTPLDDPDAVAELLGSLREAGAQEQATALLPVIPPPTSPSTTRTPWPRCWTACGRRAHRTRPPRWPPAPPPTSPSTTRARVAGLLDSLREAGARSRSPRCSP